MLPRWHRLDKLWRSLLVALLPCRTGVLSPLSASDSAEEKLSESRFIVVDEKLGWLNTGFWLREGGFSRSCPALRMLAACVESEKDEETGAPWRIEKISSPRSSQSSSAPRYDNEFLSNREVVAGRVSFLNEEEKAGECGLMGVGEITSGANLDGSRKCAAIALAI